MLYARVASAGKRATSDEFRPSRVRMGRLVIGETVVSTSDILADESVYKKQHSGSRGDHSLGIIMEISQLKVTLVLYAKRESSRLPL